MSVPAPGLVDFGVSILVVFVVWFVGCDCLLVSCLLFGVES